VSEFEEFGSQRGETTTTRPARERTA